MQAMNITPYTAVPLCWDSVSGFNVETLRAMQAAVLQAIGATFNVSFVLFPVPGGRSATMEDHAKVGGHVQGTL